MNILSVLRGSVAFFVGLAIVACGTVVREQKNVVVKTDEAKAVVVIEEKKETINAHTEPSDDRCPPLPILRDNATVFESRLHRATIIALYAQCAASKK